MNVSLLFFFVEKTAEAPNSKQLLTCLLTNYLWHQNCIFLHLSLMTVHKYTYPSGKDTTATTFLSYSFNSFQGPKVKVHYIHYVSMVYYASFLTKEEIRLDWCNLFLATSCYLSCSLFSTGHLQMVCSSVAGYGRDTKG